MSGSGEGRSASPPNSISPVRGRRTRSLSRSRRSRSRSPDSADVSNPGNNLYVTGISTRVDTSDLENFFNKEGKVTECHLVTDPRTKESRGFAFVTMESTADADRCVKYLNRAVLEGRLITVEKSLHRKQRLRWLKESAGEHRLLEHIMVQKIKEGQEMITDEAIHLIEDMFGQDLAPLAGLMIIIPAHTGGAGTKLNGLPFSYLRIHYGWSSEVAHETHFRKTIYTP